MARLMLRSMSKSQEFTAEVKQKIQDRGKNIAHHTYLNQVNLNSQIQYALLNKYY